jgi:hypothetical protein
MAGFFDGDGCVQIKVLKSSTYRLKKRIQVSLSFKQKNSYLLDCIALLFPGQNVTSFTSKATLKRRSTTINTFDIRSLKLLPILLQYFEKYNLQGLKYGQLRKAKECFNMMFKKEHLTAEGLAKIEILQKESREMVHEKYQEQ